MIRVAGLRLILIVCLTAAGSAVAEETGGKASPWDRFSLNLGAFLTTTNSTVRLGTTTAGAAIDVEDTLGIGSGNTAFRIDAAWRFTENRRHRIDFSWFSVKRSGSSQLFRDIEIDGVTYPTGTTVSTNLNLDLFRSSYSYSFFQDDRMDLAVAGGLYVAPISFDISASGGFSGSSSQSITAPLPVVGLRLDFAMTPKWFLRSNVDVFYLSYDNYTGFLTDVGVGVEYKAFEHVGFGLGFDTMHLEVEAEQGTSVPGVDFSGNFQFDYAGIYGYMKFYLN